MANIDVTVTDGNNIAVSVTPLPTQVITIDRGIAGPVGPPGPAGSVTSVALSAPALFSVSGSPITGAGTLALTYSGTALPVANGGTNSTTAQTAINTLAGAVTAAQYLRGNGTNVVMSAIQTADVPTLNQNTTGTSANVTGTVAVANGGTGLSTIAALSIPVANTLDTYTTVTPAAGQSIRINAGATSWEAYSPSAGSGTVTSVALSAPSIFTVSGSPVTTSGTLALTYSGTALPVANGGTGQTTIAALSVPVANTLNTFTSVTPAAGQSIRINAGNTAWEAYSPSAGSGTVTSVSVVSANGFAGTVATATTTPAITLSTSITGVIKGNGTAISAATAGTDYVAPGTATTFTAAQSFAASGILLKGSSTGYTTFTSANASATNYTVTVPAETMTVGYKNIPAVGTKTASYTLAVADVGKYVQVGTGGSITIPTATFAEGDIVSVFNNTAAAITITCTITTAYIAGTDADRATVSLATRGVATILFISGTVCVISGNVS